jgi:hypothetical protein
MVLGLARSREMPWVPEPIWAAISSARALSLLVMRTLSPRSAERWAMTRPRPPLPPPSDAVTRITDFSSVVLRLCPQAVECGAGLFAHGGE